MLDADVSFLVTFPIHFKLLKLQVLYYFSLKT